MNYLAQFKHVLEYFVAHLEWVQNNDTSFIGYKEYIEPIINKPNFRRTGHGYKGENIQKGISSWEKFPEGTICINVQDQFGKKDFTTKKCYLNWKGTGVNIIAHWKSKHITSLEVINYIYWEDPGRWEPGIIATSIKDLGLFENKESDNSEIDTFYNSYSNLLKQNTAMANNQTIIDTLYANHNIILNGAPGTGKTYLAKNIAAQMISGKLFSPELESDENFKAHCKFVQFHPSYDYTDFVEGLRPKKDSEGRVIFGRKDGIFKAFCKNAINIDACLKYFIESKMLLETRGASPVNFIIDEICYGTETINIHSTTNENKYTIGYIVLEDALKSNEEIGQTWFENYLKNNNLIFFEEQKNEFISHYYFSIYCKIKEYMDSPFVFIIDEINRGEMSKIFGELFFSIDPGYRGKAGLVMTQYQNLIEPTDIFFEGFYVPKNVYIIGTMNDIDRSVESMDFAMRRRFAFMEILADKNTSMLDGIKEKADVIAKMNAINQLISAEEELGSSYHIGGAYFKNVDLCRTKNGEINWEDFWDRYLYRLIYEYVRGFQNRRELLDRMKATIVPQGKDNPNSTQN